MIKILWDIHISSGVRPENLILIKGYPYLPPKLILKGPEPSFRDHFLQSRKVGTGNRLRDGKGLVHY